MAYTLGVSPPDRLGAVHLLGPVEGPEIVSAAAELAGRPDWRPGFRAVWNASRMTALSLLPGDLMALVAQERRLRTEGESGDLVIVARDSVWLSLVRLFDRRMGPEGRTLHVVPTVAAACALVGVEALPE